jgi:hypothetical protein
MGHALRNIGSAIRSASTVLELQLQAARRTGFSAEGNCLGSADQGNIVISIFLAAKHWYIALEMLYKMSVDFTVCPSWTKQIRGYYGHCIDRSWLSFGSRL